MFYVNLRYNDWVKKKIKKLGSMAKKMGNKPT